MKILLYGKNAKDLESLAREHDFDIVTEHPDVVVCYGGDGTLLRAERDFPGVPKVMLRDSKICKKCVNLPTPDVFARIKAGDYIENKAIKLEARTGSTHYVAINDITIANESPLEAVRYKLYINGKPYAGQNDIVGDGIVVATPFGAGAYYRSITDSVFSVGIGLAFNNSTEQIDHIVLKETDEIRFVVTRGCGLLAVAAEELVPVCEGTEVLIRAYHNHAKLLTFGEEFCYWAH